MKAERILLAHGSGGLMSQQLIDEMFKTTWKNEYLDAMLDGALLDLPTGRIAMSTDSFVITPIFFPGGDIGKLSICGTVNDLVACGAVPLYLSAAMVIEEGLLLADLRRIVESMAKTAHRAGVKLVTGDTKVVEKGNADKIFINTTGIGIIPAGIDYCPSRIKSGDHIIVTGTVGDHGLSLLAQREGLHLSTPVVSDCAPLCAIGQKLEEYKDSVRCMRDPTRGGLATVLNEIAIQSGCNIIVREKDIPVSSAVSSACDMLGMDPLYMANEGKMVIFTAPEKSLAIIESLAGIPDCQQSALIGEVKEGPAMVLIETELGAKRILSALEGEHVPRIC